MTTCCEFIYYATDNLVYLANLEFIDQRVPSTEVRWKKIRNFFSLIKTILQLAVAIYTIIEKSKEERLILEKLSKFTDEVVRWNSEANLHLRNLIIIRREKVFHKVEVVVFLTRMLMLIFDLKVTGYQILNPVFVAGCGIIQVCANMMKSMKSKKSFYKLSPDEIVKES